MANTNIVKNDINIDKFVNLYGMGLSPKEIQTEMGFSDTTYYKWLKDENIVKKIGEMTHILHTTGQDFVKLRYQKYLNNIDKLCDDLSDKRTCLSANTYMVDKLDGKASMNITIEDKDKDNIEDAKDLLSKIRQKKQEE